MKNVGAHNPTKIPKRSPWALASGSVPPVIYQMTMEPMMEADPGTKQALLNKLSWFVFTGIPQD